MPRFESDSGFPVSHPSAPFTPTRSPEPSVWYRSEPSSLSPVGVVPVPPAPHHCLAAPRHPKVSANPIASPDRPRPSCPERKRSSRSPSPTVTRRRRQARSDPTPSPVSRFGRRLVVAASLPKESDSPVRGGREHCPCPDSAGPRERCGLGRSPLLTAPVGLRFPERASVKRPRNPRSTALSKNTGLSPELLRYPQESCRRPRVAHRSCTRSCTGRRRDHALVIASRRGNGFNGRR